MVVFLGSVPIIVSGVFKVVDGLQDVGRGREEPEL